MQDTAKLFFTRLIRCCCCRDFSFLLLTGTELRNVAELYGIKGASFRIPLISVLIFEFVSHLDLYL